MNNKVIVGGREYLIQAENSKQYDLIDYAPDGEAVRIIVPKHDCTAGRDGAIYADSFELDANY